MMNHPLVIAYIGPETMLPIASVIGGIVGVLLIVWQRVVSFARSTYARLLGRSASTQCVPKER